MDAASPATRPGLAAAILAAVGSLVCWAFFAGGGVGTDAVATLGSAAVVLATALVVAWAFGLVALPRLDTPGRVAVLAAVGVVVWTGITVWWSIAGDRSFDALGKAIVLLAFGVIGLAASARPGRPVRAAALVLAALLAAVLCWALLGKVVPSLGPDDGGRVVRLQGSIGYWNALALLADAALGLGLWLAATARERASRPLGALLLYVATLVILLTQSRAGLVVGLAVVALVLALTEARVEAALLALLACVPGLVVAGWAFTRPALVDDGVAAVARDSDGRLLGVFVVVGAGVVLAAIGSVPVDRLVAQRRTTVVRALLVSAAVLVAVGALGLVAAVGNPVTWAKGQLTSSSEVANGPGRFGRLETNSRTVWWGEAWRVFRAHPAGGTGAGTFEIARKRVRASASNVSEPHSVPLQLLSDTGLPGLALGLTFVAAVAFGIRAALRRLEPGERGAAVALACLPFAFVLHSLVDLDLDLLAVAAPAMLVAALLLGAGRPVAGRPGAIVTAGVGVAAAAALWVLVAPALSGRAVDAAYRQSAGSGLKAAAASARRAQRLNPLSLEALYARATIAGLARQPGAADALYVKATKLQPENPDAWYQLGLFRFLEGDMCGAYVAFNEAYTLDPKSSLFARGAEFDQAKAAVNDPVHPACGTGS